MGPSPRTPRSALLARMDAALKHAPHEEAATAACACDARNWLHDYAALFSGMNGAWRRADALFSMLRVRFSEAQHARILEESADVFVTAAALGDVALLRALFHGLASWCVDSARMMELACVNGHVDAALWIRGTMAERGNVEPADPQRLRESVRCAVETLLKRNDRDVVQRLIDAQLVDEEMVTAATAIGHQQELAWQMYAASADAAAPASHQDGDVTSSAAAAVLTYAPLMPRIGAFQDDVKLAMNRLIVKISGTDRWALTPWIAIEQGDLIAFKKLTLPVLPFRLAIHFAACEDQLSVLQWLHKKYNKQISCRPDTMAMAVRCGAARGVEWLHCHCPESGQTMSTLALNDAARWGHVDVVRVCHRLTLAAFTTETVERAARGGSLAVVEFLLSLDATLATRAAMDIALKHDDVAVARCLRSIGPDFWPPDAMDVAIQRGNAAVVRWCHETNGERLNIQHLLTAITASATTMRAM